MKIGGRGVLPFVIGLGAAAGGYVALRRLTPPPPENVTKPEPSSLGGGYAGGAPPGPVADQDPVGGIQAALQGFLEQFGQPTQVEQVTPSAPPMRFEEEPAAPPPRPPQQAAPKPPQQQQPPKPAPAITLAGLAAWRNRMLPPFARRS